jgi:lysophospholipase L1-like esterase
MGSYFISLWSLAGDPPHTIAFAEKKLFKIRTNLNLSHSRRHIVKLFSKKRISPHILSLGGFISGLTVLLIFTPKPGLEMNTSHTLLCLGDSYTIGESVLAAENFPNQTISLLRKDGYAFEDPEIVAKTGWTTDQLQVAIDKHSFKNSYDFVTLLIGVNNQYRGRTVEEYRSEFESLVKQATRFANGKAEHVIVLSIPDWGVTPFARDRDTKQIAIEIDNFNAANKAIAERYRVGYIDITPASRVVASDPSLIASDGLHPSPKEYTKWSESLSLLIKSIMKQ